MNRNRGLILVVLAAVLGLSGADRAWAHGKHYPRTTRVDQVRRHGDSKMAKRVAGHVVQEAVLRYEIEDIVTDADRDFAKAQVYEFLKRQLGNPAGIAAQYISTGYGHFEKAYTDEAAAALTGAELPDKSTARLVLPKEISDYLKHEVDSLGADFCGTKKEEGSKAGGTGSTGSGSGSANAAGDGTGDEEGSTLWGVACEYLYQFIAEAAKKAIARIGFTVSEHWDIENRDVRAMIYARRHPLEAGTLASPRIATPVKKVDAPATKGKGTLPGRIGR